MGKQAKPPTPPPEPPEPEGGKSWGDPLDALLGEVVRRFPAVSRRDGYVIGEPALLVYPEHAKELAAFLKDNEICGFNFCRCVTGTDKVDRFEVVYNLARVPSPGEEPDEGFTTLAMIVVIKDRHMPLTPSLVSIWPGVGFQEREVLDLVGVAFEGHPDPRRILLDESFLGHPLRKDYPLHGRLDDMRAINAYLDEHQMKVMKEDAGEEFKPDDVPPSYKR
jgi:NADH-quinone oxidoreductase subunit C